MCRCCCSPTKWLTWISSEAFFRGDGYYRPPFFIAATIPSLRTGGKRWGGCGESKEEKAAKAEAKAVAEAKAAADAKIIEKAIRWSLKKPKGELTKADLEKVTRLDFFGQQLTEVPKGLEKLTQLTSLNFDGNKLTDVKGLEKLTQLTRLYLAFNKLTDVKRLEKLTQLTKLHLHKNQLTKVKSLEKLTQLVLKDNQLTDVKDLEKLTQLKELDLRDNPDLTKAQIDQLQKALPKCEIQHNATK